MLESGQGYITNLGCIKFLLSLFLLLLSLFVWVTSAITPVSSESLAASVVGDTRNGVESDSFVVQWADHFF